METKSLIEGAIVNEYGEQCEDVEHVELYSPSVNWRQTPPTAYLCDAKKLGGMA